MSDNRGEKKRNRIYWLEGVTESEVLKSLNDRAPSRFRQQAARRRLVVALTVLYFVLRKAAFTIAYRLLTVAFTVYVLLYIAEDALQVDPSPAGSEMGLGITALLISAAMLAASLPAMVLAWNLPSEPTDSMT